MIRADSALDALPLILATSVSSMNLRTRAADIGIRGVLAKPVRQKALIHHLIAIAGRRTTGGQAPAKPALPSRAQAQNPMRILVVDDVATNRLVASGILTKLGHRVELAGDGAEAVEKVKASNYDIIFMDVQMPLMNGVEATSVIRAMDPPKSAVPIIAMTAHAMDGDREAFLSAGMDSYISKPINAAELATVLASGAVRDRASGRV
jgi:CheY-like chemotaxis protein